MTDSFPRQAGRTIGFSLGAPRSFRLSPDGETVIFLRSKAGTDPLTCLFTLDVGTAEERLIADPLQISKVGAEDDPIEKARRERVRERQFRMDPGKAEALKPERTQHRRAGAKRVNG